MRKPLLILFLLALCHVSKAQCTKVCGTVTAISSGTFIASGTSTVTQQPNTTFTIAAKGTYTVATSYSVVTVAATNTITSGALSVSISNYGGADALFNGVALPTGATVNVNIPNATLPQYTYNCLTSKLIILVNR